MMVAKGQLPISFSSEELTNFCQRHGIQRLAVFGSVLRDDFSTESDVDVLVEFQPEHIPGLIRLMVMQDELSDILQRPVDMLTPKSLHNAIRQNVLDQARIIYDAA